MQTNSAPRTPTRQRDSRGHFVKQAAQPVVPRLAPSSITVPATPKALDPTPPVLSLFRHGSIAVLRIHDLAFSGVVSAVVHSLPADVESLMLVTPTDTKMFQVNAGGRQHVQQRDHVDSNGVLPEDSGDVGEAEEEALDPQAEAIRQAAEGDEDVAAAGIDEATAEVNMADTPAARRKAMNDLRRAEAGQASDPCGRCGGSGTMQVALPDGGASQAACPVCRGSGVIRRFGARSSGVRH